MLRLALTPADRGLSSAQVDTAYDVLLMQSLTKRRSGIVTDSRVKFADVSRPAKVRFVSFTPEQISLEAFSLCAGLLPRRSHASEVTCGRISAVISVLLGLTVPLSVLCCSVGAACRGAKAAGAAAVGVGSSQVSAASPGTSPRQFGSRPVALSLRVVSPRGTGVLPPNTSQSTLRCRCASAQLPCH